MINQDQQTRIIILRNKELSKINDKIQENERVTSTELNKLWEEFLKEK